MTHLRIFHIVFLAAIVVFTQTSCDDDDMDGGPATEALNSQFTGSASVVSQGETVNYTDQSTGNPSVWEWEFDGGTPNTSSERNPSVVYASAGKYDVKLTIRNGSTFDEELKMNFITVNAPVPVVADFSASPTRVTEGSQVTFTNTSTGGPTSSRWTFNGGDPATTEEISPTVTYNNAGVYDVTLVVTKGGASDTLTMPDLIEVIAPQEPDLLVYYPMDGNAEDESGNDYDGSISGTTTIDGRVNMALGFDGVDDKVLAVGDPQLDPVDQISIAAWVKFEAERTMTIASKYRGEPGNSGAILLATDGKVSLDGRDNGGLYMRCTADSSVVNDDEWHHVVGTVGEGTWRIYVDGELQNTITSTATQHNLNTPAPFSVGHWNQGNISSPRTFFEGGIDEVRLYNRALTADSVRVLFER